MDFLYCESGLDIPHCTNVLALIKQMPAYLPMLTGTEYLVDSGDSACDFLLCFRISDLKSLERALRGNSQYGDRYIKEISRACDICKGNTVVINMFDHIWFECDAEPSNSLSIFLGIDHAGCQITNPFQDRPRVLMQIVLRNCCINPWPEKCILGQIPTLRQELCSEQLRKAIS